MIPGPCGRVYRDVRIPSFKVLEDEDAKEIRK